MKKSALSGIHLTLLRCSTDHELLAKFPRVSGAASLAGDVETASRALALERD
jgi:hypothetical protein